MAGKLYLELHKISIKASDKKEAIDILQRVIKHFPGSEYKIKSEEALSAFPELAIKSKSIEKPIEKSIDKPVEKQINKQNKPLYLIEDLRFWSNPNYTRVVINLNHETPFVHKLLEKDPSIQKPPRLYIDFENTKLPKRIKSIIPINDDLLTSARAGQYTLTTVRIVVDIKSFQSYKIFSLNNPFRIIIDIWGKPSEKPHYVEKPKQPITPPSTTTKIPPSAIAKQLALGVKLVIIDPGHGGHDIGAPTSIKGIAEKDIVMEISKKLAQKIHDKLGCKVILTRNDDNYLTLEERTAIANTKNADIFISMHANSTKDQRAYGIETYFLNLATDDDAIRVAARENATSTKNISDLQSILNDLMQNAKINESSRLAGYVQKSLTGHLSNKYDMIKDKGVKQAPFYVLLGAHMPAILVEAGFISNPKECQRIITHQYQNELCEAIVKGIKDYINELNPTSLIRTNPSKSAGS
ncbi:MAG: N-acetylmuramoyl-L-alanine amidase [Desulfobacterales bacterium]|nr:N-acetylmuramoyl-L-alanine amidase [Desulfobacterales bacterium]MBF0398933.1 N-acetylmuramoyl-L-alanine amidase [Desulfobacterales bacterium]